MYASRCCSVWAMASRSRSAAMTEKQSACSSATFESPKKPATVPRAACRLAIRFMIGVFAPLEMAEMDETAMALGVPSAGGILGSAARVLGLARSARRGSCCLLNFAHCSCFMSRESQRYLWCGAWLPRSLYLSTHSPFCSASTAAITLRRSFLIRAMRHVDCISRHAASARCSSARGRRPRETDCSLIAAGLPRASQRT
mmetsp:Transcript_6329/g.14618  ORF Transcript_6329/g.14618 Transcript_6329/m.14618 type:complete len:200 (-) Transcript_6329:229-828(-)